MSFEVYSREAVDALSRAVTEARVTDDENNEIAMAQVFATLALAEAIREGLALLVK